MTSAPAHDGYVEDEDGCLCHMPFDVAHALLRLAWHESWRESLIRAEAIGSSYLESLKHHKERVKEARETWNVLAMPWASGPRGGQRGRLVVENVTKLAKASAKHCALMRIYEEKEGKGVLELQQPAHEPYKDFESARSALEELHGTLAHALFERICDLLWASGWHAANSVANKESKEQEEEEEQVDEDEEEEEDDDDEEEKDEQDPFGDDYPGSSDDPVEDMREILSNFHGLFNKDEAFRGVRCSLSSENEGAAVLGDISRVPGAFGDARCRMFSLFGTLP